MIRQNMLSAYFAADFVIKKAVSMTFRDSLFVSQGSPANFPMIQKPSGQD